MKARVGAILGCVTILAACGPQATQHRPSPSASRSATPRTTPVPLDQVPPDLSERWAQLGATLVPPTGYLQKIDFNAEVINHSGGKVDDATARRWAEGLEREFLWVMWVDENLQMNLLPKLGRKDGMTQMVVFSDDYSAIHKAQDVGGHLNVAIARRSRMTLVPVATDLQQTLTQSYQYTPPLPEWAFAVDLVGPARVALIYPDGHRESLHDLPSSFTDRVFVAGTYQDYPDSLGPIWLLSTYLSCPKNDFLRAACGA